MKLKEAVDNIVFKSFDIGDILVFENLGKLFKYRVVRKGFKNLDFNVESCIDGFYLPNISIGIFQKYKVRKEGFEP